jgi:serine/threonine protein phosphatase PrpC
MTDLSTRAGGVVACPACLQPVAAGDVFCESCGSALVDVAEGAVVPGVAAQESLPRTTLSQAPGLAVGCLDCGGAVLDNGFCSNCGHKAPSPRDHWQESPVAWIGGVCDKGIVHARNEDAMALAGLRDHSLGVLVVCDGVTSAPDSDRAALVAARDACAALVATPVPLVEGAAALISAWSNALIAACADANAAAVGVARSLGDPSEPPSCTFVAAVLHRNRVTVGWCGDSRAYWLPDDGEAIQLMVDHSLGTALLQSGVSQADAERDPAFHTITSWLGADSVDFTPDITSHELQSPGWLLVCSDGLWNYASAAATLQLLVARFVGEGHETPVAIAAALVRWANEQGGHDNITAALARHEPSLR